MRLSQWAVGFRQQQQRRLFELKLESQHVSSLARAGPEYVYLNWKLGMAEGKESALARYLAAGGLVTLKSPVNSGRLIGQNF